MKSPTIRIQNSGRLLIEASFHFGRNFAYFLVLSTIPLLGLYTGTVIVIAKTERWEILLISISLFLFIYLLTMHISWETCWGKRPTLVTFTRCFFKVAFKHSIILLLYFIAIFLIPAVCIVFIPHIIRHFIRIYRTTLIWNACLLLSSVLGLIITISNVIDLTDVTQSILTRIFLLVLLFSAYPFSILLMVPTISFFEGYGPLKSFLYSIRSTSGYVFHIIPFYCLQILLVATITFLITSTSLPFGNFVDMELWFIAGFLYVLFIPFFINLRVFYYQDLVLRNEGYNSLFAIRSKTSSQMNEGDCLSNWFVSFFRLKSSFSSTDFKYRK